MINLVEMVEDGVFNQRCKYGYLIDGYAVYCHNHTWKEAPRKCRHSWFWGKDKMGSQDEDCPGFSPNDKKRIKGQ